MISNEIRMSSHHHTLLRLHSKAHRDDHSRHAAFSLIWHEITRCIWKTTRGQCKVLYRTCVVHDHCGPNISDALAKTHDSVILI